MRSAIFMLTLAGCNKPETWTEAWWSGPMFLPDQTYENGHPLVTSEPQSDHDRDVEDRLVELIRQWRAAKGLRPWQRDGALDGLARGYAAHMPVERFIGNTAPEGDLFPDRAYRASGEVVYGPWREMLAFWGGEPTADSILTAWAGSAADLETLLATDVNAFGVGIWTVAGETWVVVELCVRPE